MKDLRQISLCNVAYKIVSKLLANRLKKCLDKCIGEEQSDFVEGRSILDNSMIAFEVIHVFKKGTSGKNAQLDLKIDMSKAYDRMNWARKMFEAWDPLSLYIFILIIEGLSALIRGAVARGDLHRIHIFRGASSVSHLIFADDCFLFCRTNLIEVHNIMEILNLYDEASGQDINLSIFEVFFSRNIRIPAQEDLASIMGVRHVLGTGTYLGLPSLIGRSKKATFGYVKDMIWKKINSWKGSRYLK
ncbi:uncharacterized protein LOC131650282 [Vicia villosa]|uniref:uncharacterized protein LOC131650282 n=1 Tax=Vicia villosa TaxID=3911 RepID=UPI00273BF7F3|nr:uncharacterized protein LOC131650282 [Vicia villosa]